MKASVLMPVYNTPLDWLKGALKSLENQTNKDFELVVVDDNSDISLSQFLINYKRIDILLRRIKNEGLAAALNSGLKVCTGDIIIRMDSDDIAMPELVESHINFFEHNRNRHICGIQIELFNDVKSWHSHHLPIVTREKAYKMDGYWITNHPGIAYRRETINKLGGYASTPLGMPEDYELWVKFLLAGYEIYNRAELLMRYRAHSRPERHADKWFNYLDNLKQQLHERNKGLA